MAYLTNIIFAICHARSLSVMYSILRNKYQSNPNCVRVITSGDPALSDHALSVFLVMSRATIRRMCTARRSPLVPADDFLLGTGRHILTARRSVPVISDGLMFTAAASFARQPPRAGPPATLLAAALATPLPRTRYSLPPASHLTLVLR